MLCPIEFNSDILTSVHCKFLLRIHSYWCGFTFVFPYFHQQIHHIYFATIGKCYELNMLLQYRRKYFSLPSSLISNSFISFLLSYCNSPWFECCVYVDDFVVTSTSEKDIKEFKQQMIEEFEMTDLRLLMYYFGI